MKSNNPIFVRPRESNRTKKNDTRNLPYDILAPCYFSDPIHHQNIVGGNMWQILGKGKNKTPIKKCNCMQVEKIDGFTAKQNREKWGGGKNIK